jgi:hypothetical protein
MAVRQGQIEEDDVDPALLQARDPGRKAIHMGKPEPVMIRLREKFTQEPDIARIVFDEQDMDWEFVHGQPLEPVSHCRSSRDEGGAGNARPQRNFRGLTENAERRRGHYRPLVYCNLPT